MLIEHISDISYTVLFLLKYYYCIDSLLDYLAESNYLSDDWNLYGTFIALLRNWKKELLYLESLFKLLSLNG